MKDRVLYQSYAGDAPYIFLQYSKGDRHIASQIVNHLNDRRFRICYDEHDPRAIGDADRVANRILSSCLTVILLSADAAKSLAFRNRINFALSKKKRMFCIYLDDKKLDSGLMLQLANVPGAAVTGYPDAAALCDDIMRNGVFVQDARGAGAKAPIQHSQRRKVAIGLLSAVLALCLVTVSVFVACRIHYQNSLPGQIEKLTKADYLDISGEDASILALLEGKTIQTLVARSMGLTDIEVLAGVDCVSLDLSDNPGVQTLEPLLSIGNLETVTVTQDMYPAIVRVDERRRFRIVIAR